MRAKSHLSGASSSLQLVLGVGGPGDPQLPFYPSPTMAVKSTSHWIAPGTPGPGSAPTTPTQKASFPRASPPQCMGPPCTQSFKVVKSSLTPPLCLCCLQPKSPPLNPTPATPSAEAAVTPACRTTVVASSPASTHRAARGTL